MSDWREKLAGLNQQLQAQERAEDERKAATLKGFRKRLDELQPVVEEAQAFGDAFGVEMTFHISRFDERYPYLELAILKPRLQYRVECRDGVITERLKEGEIRPREQQVSLESLAAKPFEQRLTGWVRTAAEANRRVPGRGSGRGTRS